MATPERIIVHEVFTDPRLFREDPDQGLGRWKCIQCGNCCRILDKFADPETGIPYLPEFDRGDGVCIHLKADNMCAIYEKRPEVCRYSPKRSAHANAWACAVSNMFFEDKQNAHRQS